MEIMQSSRQDITLQSNQTGESLLAKSLNLWKQSTVRKSLLGYPIGLINVAAGVDRLLSQNDFKEFLSLLTLAYRINFADHGSLDFGTAKDIFGKMLERHWTFEECIKITDNFRMTNPWKNFTMAEFFGKTERPSLYGEAWKNAEKEKNINAIADMECYEVPDGTGETVKMYRYKDPTHPVNGLTDIWAKQNIMRAYSCAAGEEPQEFTPSKAACNPDATIDCEKFLSGFAKNLFSSGDYDRLNDAGKRFIDEYLHIKKRQSEIEGKNTAAV